LRIAGNLMDDKIIEHLKYEHHLLIGERTAEAIKMEVGSAYPLDRPSTFEVKGRDFVKGIPRTVTVDDAEIRKALSPCVTSIVQAIRLALERTPPELSADISDRGIVLTGGTSLLKNLDKRIQAETGLLVSLSEDPLTSVVLGTAKMLDDFKLLRKLSLVQLN
jgi:rod shape-determining protein MreB